MMDNREAVANQPLWRPPPQQALNSAMHRFLQLVNATFETKITNDRTLSEWALACPEKFWPAVWDFVGIVAKERGTRVYDGDLHGPCAPGGRWFPEARLNFARNLLRFRDDRPACIFHGEEVTSRTLTYRELYRLVRALRADLVQGGLSAGQRVAAIVPNMPETIAAMLASASLGAVWASCSPDFGLDAIVDRFGQIEPTILFTADCYYFKGKRIDCLARVPEILSKIPSIERVIILPYSGDAASNLEGSPSKAITLAEVLAKNPDVASPATEIEFVELPFDHPLYIMFSSGTTGKPKCIVHSAGGTLLEQLKELVIHTGLHREDTLFYQTTCGWMMWNWLVSGLAVGASLVLYDGFPLANHNNILWDLAQKHHISVFGTNAKYLALIEKEGVKPGQSHRLGDLRAILSTGSPLLPESFDYVFRDIKSQVHLQSISGGTDILGCFLLGSPLRPVHRGELQMASLGLAVNVFNEDGVVAVQGQSGELVCTRPFPSMPIYFWNDPSGEKYRAAYFDRFPGVWCHGDYTTMTANGGYVISGRSDATLNPGGVRIGTAELYAQVEKFPEIAESLVVGQDHEGDVRVILFVKMAPQAVLDDTLRSKINSVIRTNTSPRHVPFKILAVRDIPRTRSGKIVELTVRDILHGRPVKNSGALANPEALDEYTALRNALS